MNQRKEKIKAVGLPILLIMMVILFFVFAFGAITTAKIDLYGTSAADEMKRMQKSAQEKSSLYILRQYFVHDDTKSLASSNLEYGIIETEGDIDTLDENIWSNENNYLYQNFTTTNPNEDSMMISATKQDDISVDLSAFNHLLGYGGDTYHERYGSAEDKNYWVISNIKAEKDWEADDIFAKEKKIITTAYRFRYVTLIGAGVTFLISIMLVIVCGVNAYTRGKNRRAELQEGKKIPFFCRIPLEIITLVVGLVGGACLSEIDYLIQETFVGSVHVVYGIIFLFLLFGIATVTGVLFFCNLCSRAGYQVFWKNTVCYGVVGIGKRMYAQVREHTGLFVKTVLIFGAISFGELFFYVVGAEGNWEKVMIVWFLIKLLEAPVVWIVVMQLQKLQQGSEELSKGNLNYTLDTTKMLWEFKKHGDNLNRIGEGMTIALNERMKSEHLRTELITNVSHDIKTPLTSIINYVDLLKKQGITEEEREEYIEVLVRQSERLKNLVVDLLDASKASTGNVEIKPGACDVGILLTQIGGEYEEKMMEKHLELCIQTVEEPMIIQTDSRHLWRVMDNLMNNICKYAQSDTRVYINTESKQGKLCMIFRNTSKYPLNISGEELMERFVRGDSSRNTEGSGLGLSIAQSLTKLLGGKMDIIIDGDLFKVILELPCE